MDIKNFIETYHYIENLIGTHRDEFDEMFKYMADDIYDINSFYFEHLELDDNKIDIYFESCRTSYRIIEAIPIEYFESDGKLSEWLRNTTEDRKKQKEEAARKYEAFEKRQKLDEYNRLKKELGL